MKEQEFKLTNTDYIAIEKKDSNYINNKGAARYKEETFKESVEYYHLASAMGDDQATSNLGYCYLYGRGIEPNISLAVGYFRVAARFKNVEACYKLGDIYSSDKWGLKDAELSIYFYRLAASFILDDGWNQYSVMYCSKFINHPSLAFALGRELTSGENMTRDLETAFMFLKHAKRGYEKEIMNGATMYIPSLEGVISLLNDDIFDEIRDELNSRYNNYYTEDDEDGYEEYHEELEKEDDIEF